jgi:exo-1,4-beta-D-glucosaminidase
MAILCSCNGEISSDNESLMLDQNWHLQSSKMIEATGKDISSTNFSPGEWYEVDLPSTVLAALVENGVYKDPYYGDNLKSIPGYREGRWLAMKEDSPFYPSWWYRKEFTIPLNYKGKNMILHLDGINYKANVWLNRQQIADSGQVKGMFRRFEFDINQFANPGGRNVLAVEIISPGHIPDIPYHTKQLEATTGWDDHNPQPPDLNMGIWRSIYITTTGAVDLKHPYISTDLDLPSLAKAHLIISTELTNKTEQKVNGELKCVIENLTFSKKVNLNPFETKVIKLTPAEFSQLNIVNPRIWWPHPHGKQELYTLNIAFNINGKISDQQDVKFGIREVSTYINDEGWRGYKVNGKNILIRGGAWMTSDMLLRFSKRRYEALVRYAREANLNMLRSEGFSIRETDEFYDICDKYGIMVTQQIFGRNLPD